MQHQLERPVSDIPLTGILDKSDSGSSIDSWMLTYLDVFVQMTAIFMVLFMMTHHQTEPELETATALTTPTANTAITAPADRAVTAPDLEPELATKLEVTATNWQANLYDQVASLGISKRIEVSLEDNSARLTIEDDVLFDSAEAELKFGGKTVLQELATLIKGSEGIIFIEGHTDDRPIHTPDYPSNWVLASARANTVLHFLIASGIDEKRLRAISYGDTKPVVPNTSESNRQKNRRVSLVLKPLSLID